jgi:hypothetical protein
MNYVQFFCLLAAVYLAPHAPKWLCVLLGVVFTILAAYAFITKD